MIFHFDADLLYVFITSTNLKIQTSLKLDLLKLQMKK